MDKKDSPKKKGWWGRLLVLVILVGLVWFAPAFVALTDMRHWIAEQIFSELRGQIHVGSASLSWLSPVVLDDVEFRDPDGQVYLTVGRVESNHTLLQLLSDMSNVGLFRCESADLQVVFSGGESNLEKALHDYLYPEEDNSGSLLAVDVEVVNGTVQIHDAEKNRRWKLALSKAFVSIPKGSVPLKVQIEGRWQETNKKVVADLSWKGWNQPLDSPTQEAKVFLEAEDFPLEVVGPLLRRFDSSAQLSGDMNARLEGSLIPGESETRIGDIEGAVSVANLKLTGTWLGEDQVHLTRVDIPCRLKVAGSQVRIEEAALKCDLATASVVGTFDPTQNWQNWLQEPGVEISADVDLARVARMLPDTFHLHKETSLTSGKVSLRLRSSSQDEVVWSGKLETSQIEGVSQGKRVSVEKPISLTFQARLGSDSWPILDKLDCESSFLQAHLTNFGQQWTLSANCNLEQLTEQVSQFVDLGPLQFQGKGNARVIFFQDEQNQFRLQGQASCQSLRIGTLEQPWLQEPNLSLTLAASGRVDQTGPTRCQQANLKFLAGEDEVRLQLLDPVDFGKETSPARVKMNLQGDLSRWQKRLNYWVGGFDSLKMAGQGDMEAELRLLPQAVECLHSRLDLTSFTCQGYGLSIREPSVTLTTEGRLNLTSGAMELTNAKVTADTIQVQMPRVLLRTDENNQPRLSGFAQVQGELQQLRRWMQDPAAPPSMPLSAQLAGQLKMDSSAEQVTIDLDLKGHNFLMGDPKNPIWRDPVLRISCQGAYQSPTDVLDIQKLRLESSLLQCDTQGQIGQVSGRQNLNLKGQIVYDLKKLEPLLQHYLGSGIELTGAGTGPLELAGPLASPPPLSGLKPTSMFTNLRGQTRLHWQSANLYGFRCESAEVRGHLGKGWLQTEPIHTTINKGKLNLQAFLQLDSTPMSLYLQKGKVIGRAQITPAMATSAVKYALPALANMVQGSGALSLELQGAKIPLDDPTQADIAGLFTIHQAQIGASPFLRELTSLLNSPAQAQIRPGSVVPFRMVKGRVYHKDLEIVFPDLTITTSGWVGLDGSLAMTAEFPIPPKWTQGGKVGKLLANQKVAIPLRGTLNDPQLDAQALNRAFQQWLQQSGQKMLENELENQLKKLFGPQR